MLDIEREHTHTQNVIENVYTIFFSHSLSMFICPQFYF